MSRILKTGKDQITQKYSNNHKGIDIVKYKNSLDYVIAHSSGVVEKVVKNYNRTDKTGGSYGNYVLIKHSNGYYTLYAHLKYGSVTVSKGQKVKKGQVLGYMGNTGYSKGAHLHFEVRNRKNERINPTIYLNNDLPTDKKSVFYRVYSNNEKRWFNVAKDGKVAGNEKDFIGGFQIRTEKGGSTKYCAHIYNGKWLDEVNKWDNTDNGYAGIKGKDIDGLAIWSEKGKLSYRVKTDKKGWLPWVTGYNLKDSKNGYAGNLGEKIVAVEVKLS